MIFVRLAIQVVLIVVFIATAPKYGKVQTFNQIGTRP